MRAGREFRGGEQPWGTGGVRVRSAISICSFRGGSAVEAFLTIWKEGTNRNIPAGSSGGRGVGEICLDLCRMSPIPVVGDCVTRGSRLFTRAPFDFCCWSSGEMIRLFRFDVSRKLLRCETTACCVQQEETCMRGHGTAFYRQKKCP